MDLSHPYVTASALFAAGLAIGFLITWRLFSAEVARETRSIDFYHQNQFDRLLCLFCQCVRARIADRLAYQAPKRLLSLLVSRF